ncbi:MAG: gamma-glutamyltransferase [endosymbiont of Escarpia spicata]|uniref:Gamma-glutamyltransferase n=1 Tax=endosymbiont of Escarpia spicata TaxID=2200908 RepID=A0A370DGI5_9GAMM|nr:MAG: gamma-glutamyltransferase [endosymbiont of Escarpia spicata]
MRKKKTTGGVVAAGHQETANAALQILQEGGNAFDAAIAAMFTACVAEPALASLGGGGFLTARPVNADPLVYDFFAHTPSRKQPEAATNLHPIVADFGNASQTFHIGMGSIATPGFIKGVFAIHRERCSMPLKLLAMPAINAAIRGVRVNPFQHLISGIVQPILRSSNAAFQLHSSTINSDQLAQVGETRKQPEMAAFFEHLCREGEALFYLGEAGQQLTDTCRESGGHLRPHDLKQYQAVKRKPLERRYRQARIFTNPTPALGGTLIAFTLALLESYSLDNHLPGDADHLRRVIRAICLTQHLRTTQSRKIEKLLNEDVLREYRQRLHKGGICTRGTTQISILDRQDNLASMTLSNGEGSGYVIPGTGIMMNNMLGEEDINPCGFHNWPEDERIASMMSPTLAFLDQGRIVVTGSGGSNRIRSAILQVLSNLIDFDMPLQQAVAFPRIHFEEGLLSMEPGVDQSISSRLATEFPRQRQWDSKNLFFGGAHTVMLEADGGLIGAGDERRGGVWLSTETV